MPAPCFASPARNHIPSTLSATAKFNSLLDALKYRSLLLLHRGDLDGAERSFDSLRTKSRGKENASYRADAHLGLGAVKIKRGPEFFDGALQSFATALANVNAVPSSEQDHYTFAQIYMLQGEIYGTAAQGAWQGADPAKAIEYYRKALNSLNQVPKKRKIVESDMRDVRSKIERLEAPQ
jgi:tetratricopeptide (TPR) repeat protein